MDETQIFFNLVLNKSVAKKDSKSITVRTSGCEKKTRDSCSNHNRIGDILTPMIIFPGSIDCTIKDLTLPHKLCIVTQ